MSSDDFFDNDAFDSAFLAEVDMIEVVAKPPSPVKRIRSPKKTPSTSRVIPWKKPSSQRSNKHEESDPFDDTLDVIDLEELDEVMARGYTDSAPGPSRGWSKNMVQSTLDGGKLAASPKKVAPSRNLSRAGSSNNAAAPVQRLRKTKQWDHTAFAKTGWKRTKSSKDKKEKGKAKAAIDDDEDEEMEDDEDLDMQELSMTGTSVQRIKEMSLDFDPLAIKEWIYPLNNPKRDYQFNIVKKCLFENTLVALPTGLGKTFIAGCVMLNYYNWFPEGKIIFVAPTKPLVAQQIEASHNVCGIPGNEAVELTGQIQRDVRAQHWQTKRVFYMTPQTLVNDLSHGICDPTQIVLLVVDEAHKGTGDYAYAQVVRYLMATNPFHRILALTATPGSTSESVQAIIDSLHISHIEIRDEESLDLRPYLHKKNVTHHIIKITEGVEKIRGHLIKLMEDIIKPLINAGIYSHGNMVMMSSFAPRARSQTLAPKERWASGALNNLSGLARAMEYLMTMSVGMAHGCLKDLGEPPEEKKEKPGKKAKPSGPRKIAQNPNYAAFMREVELHKNIVHPKMEKLRDTAVQYFANAEVEEEQRIQDTGAKPGKYSSSTKMIVFCSFRECVDEIVELLNAQQPMIRAHRFIGQGADKKGAKGVSQREQLEVIKSFKEGTYNVIVSTSIGEEGLDIGEVDVIICYDVQKDPLRLLQRIGRTGRKRDGRVEVFVAEGREDENWRKAMDKYRHVQHTIIKGTDIELYGDVHRLLPAEAKPQCIEMTLECRPYVRPGGKRTESKNSAGGKRKRDLNIGDMMKSSRTKSKGKEKKEESEEEEDDESPPAKKRRFLQDSSDDDGILTKKPKKKRSVSQKQTRIDITSKSATVPLNGFTTAKDAMTTIVLTSDDDDDLPSLLELPPKAKISKPKSTSVGPSASIPTSIRPVSKPTTKPPPKPQKEDMSWLLDSDSESENLKPPLAPRTNFSKVKMPISVRQPLKPAASANQVPIIDLEDDDEFNDIDSLGADLVLTPSPRPTPVRKPQSPVFNLTQSSPDSSFPLPRPRAPARRMPSLSPTQASPVIMRRRIARREIDEEQDALLMPPPPIPSKSQPDSSAPKPSISRPTGANNKNGKKKQPVSILDRNAFLEMEAVHSGDEVDKGLSGDSSGEEHDSDREFLVDTSLSQMDDDDEEQENIYRQSLFTQAPANGPKFLNKPLRRGGRPTQILKRVQRAAREDLSSSPDRLQPDQEDEDDYMFGSFIVRDEDEIIYDSSSSQIA